MAQRRRSIEAIIVSPEMTTLIGEGDLAGTSLPGDAAVLVFGSGDRGKLATVRIVSSADAEPLGDSPEGADSISFVVAREALERLFAWTPNDEGEQIYHLTNDLRSILLSIRGCERVGHARTTYLLAKSIELLCETVQQLADELLIPSRIGQCLSRADTNRVVAARRMIDERWSEKLTLDSIARACGLNRAKLTRGFRDLYRCTVAEAIAERRLDAARLKLLTTDLPVSVVGYESGYLNNASFARAFGRRFGSPPTGYRAGRIAA